jgi:5,10-methylenetetrahydromethanopterin reductase
MDFGICVMPKPDRCAEEARLAESLGFSHVWIADTQLMAGEAYVCLALIAAATKRIKIGTGVAIAGTRIAPVTACALGSLNQLAPGRVVFGVGTGNSARRAMGLPPYTLRDLREYVQVVRGLLSGGEVDYREGTEHRAIRFFHQEMHFVNLRDQVPIYVAANQPKAMELAGEIGDGFITSRTNTVHGWNGAWGRVSANARRHCKNPAEMYTVLLTTASILGPGESADSPRVRAEVGPWTMVALHALYEGVTSVEMAPAAIRPVFEEYKAYMDDRMGGDSRYYLQLHDGHGLYLRPDEERFATAELIQHATMTSAPDDLRGRLRALAAAGVKQVAFIPATGHFREFTRTFSDEIMARL